MTLPRKAPLSKGVAEAYVPVAGVARGSVVAAVRAAVDRSVAAATASRKAERTPCCSSTRRPGGRGARRRGDRRPQRLGTVVALREEGGGAEEGLDRQRLADVARQPGQHPGLDEGLRHQEDVGRAGARQAGDGVEQRLLDPHDGAHRAEERLGPRQVVVGGGGAGGDGRGAGADERRRCWAWPARPRDPGARSASSAAMVTPAAIDSTRLGPLAASARQAVATSPGFTAMTLPSAASGSSTTSTPGKAACSAASRLGIGLDDADPVEPLAAGGEQAADQRLAHAAAADHLEHAPWARRTLPGVGGRGGLGAEAADALEHHEPRGERRRRARTWCRCRRRRRSPTRPAARSVWPARAEPTHTATTAPRCAAVDAPATTSCRVGMNTPSPRP